jgi:hypothetical protein
MDLVKINKGDVYMRVVPSASCDEWFKIKQPLVKEFTPYELIEFIKSVPKMRGVWNTDKAYSMGYHAVRMGRSRGYEAIFLDDREIANRSDPSIDCKEWFDLFGRGYICDTRVFRRITQFDDLNITRFNFDTWKFHVNLNVPKPKTLFEQLHTMLITEIDSSSSASTSLTNVHKYLEIAFIKRTATFVKRLDLLFFEYSDGMRCDVIIENNEMIVHIYKAATTIAKTKAAPRGIDFD